MEDPGKPGTGLFSSKPNFHQRQIGARFKQWMLVAGPWRHLRWSLDVWSKARDMAGLKACKD